MYAKYAKIYKAQEYEHNYVIMHLRNNEIKFTYVIKVLEAYFYQLTTFELVFDTFIKHNVASCTQFYT